METCVVARRKNKPYVITPHGMLYPNALKRSYWKKWPLIQLFFKKDILEATCLHATCKQEMDTDRLLAMGERGRQLVTVKYTDTQVALKMKQLYEWILTGGEKPKFVYI